MDFESLDLLKMVMYSCFKFCGNLWDDVWCFSGNPWADSLVLWLWQVILFLLPCWCKNRNIMFLCRLMKSSRHSRNIYHEEASIPGNESNFGWVLCYFITLPYFAIEIIQKRIYEAGTHMLNALHLRLATVLKIGEPFYDGNQKKKINTRPVSRISSGT